MNDFFTIDVEKLATELGIGFEEPMAFPPGQAPQQGNMPAMPPDLEGKPPKRFQHWDGEILEKVLTAVSAMDPGEKKILLTGQVPSWAIAAIADLSQDREVYNYVYYLEQSVAMPRLPMGVRCEAGGVGFQVREDGDKVYVQYIADDPADGHSHSYDYQKLPEVKIPQIPAGKDIFIAGYGATFVQVAIALGYTNQARSVWLAFHGGNGAPGTESTYHCAVTKTNTIALGQAHTVMHPAQ